MFKTKTSNIKNNLITTIHEQTKSEETHIVDLSFTNIRKDYPIFIDVWIENELGERFYLNYNKKINNYNATNNKENETFKHPIKLISIEKQNLIRIKSYIDIKDSTSSTPSDWASFSIEEWKNGYPWASSTTSNLDWYEGSIADWVTNMDNYINSTLQSPLSNPYNCSVFLTLNIENN